MGQHAFSQQVILEVVLRAVSHTSQCHLLLVVEWHCGVLAGRHTLLTVLGVGVVGAHEHTHLEMLIGQIPNCLVAELGAGSGAVVREPVRRAFVDALVVVAVQIRVGWAYLHASTGAVVSIIVTGARGFAGA